jgi:hypothetical protein
MSEQGEQSIPQSETGSPAGTAKPQETVFFQRPSPLDPSKRQTFAETDPTEIARFRADPKYTEVSQQAGGEAMAQKERVAQRLIGR